MIVSGIVTNPSLVQLSLNFRSGSVDKPGIKPNLDGNSHERLSFIKKSEHQVFPCVIYNSWFYNSSMLKNVFHLKLATSLLILMLVSGCMAASPTPASTLPHPTQITQKIPTASPTLLPSTPKPAKATSAPVCTEQKGEWKADKLPADGLNADVPFNIYLPPCYGFDPTHRYPLLILLHGSGDAGDENMWPNLGVGDAMDRKIAAGMPPFLVASPRISNLQGDYLGVSQTIAKTLVAFIDANYSTKTSPSYRALGGLSYGAIWTVLTATVFPEEFSKLGMHSSAVQLTDMVAFSQKMLALSVEKRPLIWLDAGVNDTFLWSDTKMDEVLNTDRIAHFWHLGPGAHDQAYWRANLDDYLSFYSAGW